MEILITSGGTEEPIDGVRTISNFSTGRTGAVIADFLSKNGFKVTLLSSKRAILPTTDTSSASEPIKIEYFSSFNSLDQKLEELLSSRKFTAVVHAAAVSDYSVDYLESDGFKIPPSEDIKLDSSKPLSIILKPNHKIIDRIKNYSLNKSIKLIGFKLTKNASDDLVKEKVSKVLKRGHVDYVVQNDLTNITPTSHITTIYTPNGVYGKCKTKEELAKTLGVIFKESL